MALQVKKDFPGNGMTFPESDARRVDLNLLFSVLTVISRYRKDAVGLPVSRNEVFESSLYRTGTRTFFNRALSALHREGLITLTPFAVSLTPSGFSSVYGIRPDTQ